jgi:hypothetical protein
MATIPNPTWVHRTMMSKTAMQRQSLLPKLFDATDMTETIEWNNRAQS